MSQPLSDFLADLATDAERLGAFLADPDAVLAASDLSPEDQAALLSRETAQVAAAIDRGAAG